MDRSVADVLLKSGIAFSGYSCNGVNLYGDKESIDKAKAAFHYAGGIPEIRERLLEYKAKYEEAQRRLDLIVAIPNSTAGGDWDEIEQAREIALKGQI